MTKENQTPEPESTSEPKPEAPPEPTVSNADVKNHPLFTKLTQELAATKGKLDELANAEAAAKAEAEKKRLEEEGNYKEALERTKAEYQQKLDALQAESLQKDLTNSFMKAGFNNEVFIRGATLTYNAEEHGDDIDAFVKTFAEDEANKVFMGQARQVQKPAVAPKANDPQSVSMTDELAEQYMKSGDLDKRKLARDHFEAKFKAKLKHERDITNGSGL